jgi:hypothetical protein
MRYISASFSNQGLNTTLTKESTDTLIATWYEFEETERYWALIVIFLGTKGQNHLSHLELFWYTSSDVGVEEREKGVVYIQSPGTYDGKRRYKRMRKDCEIFQVYLSAPEFEGKTRLRMRQWAVDP